MADRGNLIRQFVALKKQYVPPRFGETDQDLVEHYAYELEHDEIAWLEKDGRVVAFADWSWISCPEDIAKANEGRWTEGEVLYIHDLVLTEPELIRELKRVLPPARYFAGLHKGKVHAPKGWPTDEKVAV